MSAYQMSSIKLLLETSIIKILSQSTMKHFMILLWEKAVHIYKTQQFFFSTHQFPSHDKESSLLLLPSSWLIFEGIFFLRKTMFEAVSEVLKGQHFYLNLVAYFRY